MKYLFILCSCLTMCSFGDKRSQGLSEHYYFERDFSGAAYVVFNHGINNSPDSHGSTRTYRVPPNGILVTELPFIEERRDLPKCFVMNSDGNYVEIPFVINPDSTTEGTYCCCLSTRKSFGELSGLIKYAVLFVGTTEQIDSAYSIVNISLLDSTLSIIKNRK